MRVRFKIAVRSCHQILFKGPTPEHIVLNSWETNNLNWRQLFLLDFDAALRQCDIAFWSSVGTLFLFMFSWSQILSKESASQEVPMLKKLRNYGLKLLFLPFLTKERICIVPGSFLNTYMYWFCFRQQGSHHYSRTHRCKYCYVYVRYQYHDFVLFSSHHNIFLKSQRNNRSEWTKFKDLKKKVTVSINNFECHI